MTLPSLSATDLATLRQRAASDPYASAWVDASAGSGKTKVLIDRVLRLLLAGTLPQRILCLTYTKAAAANMAVRLSNKLSHWATASEAELAKELHTLMDTWPDEAQLARARQLFALTLDTPGGLQFLTIHSFCQSLLARFPLEAQVPVGFQVLEDRQSQSLLGAARQKLLTLSVTEPDHPLAQALTHLLEKFPNDRFLSLEREIIGKRARLEKILAHGPALPLLNLRRLLLIEEGETQESVRAAFCRDTARPVQALREAARVLLTSSKSMKTNGEALARWLALDAAAREKELGTYINIFLTQENTVRDRLVVKDIVDNHPEVAALIAQESEAVLALSTKLTALATYATSSAVIQFAAALLHDYQQRKAQMLALDYDDLIARAAALVTQQNSAWVLYKLDEGLEHVLVDEAQDTNPRQWDILENLTGDFFSGESAHDSAPARTIFGVGDYKQSIYSFQGADPEAFVSARARFAAKLEAVGKSLQRIDFSVSFRSTSAVLSSVDKVFFSTRASTGMGANYREHISAAPGIPGTVEVWPPAPADEQEEAEAFPLPARRQGRLHPQSKLARVLAQQIREWIDKGETLPGRPAPLRYGDILILVRARGSFVPELVRACKQAGVPVSGADRMLLTEQLAVEDLLSYLNFLLLPEDDLTLAEVLKSPLIGLSEEQLFELAHGRGGASLWQRLAQNPMTRAHAAWLAERLNEVDRATPYTLLARVLASPCPADGLSGRRALLKRLGQEASDPLDELLNAALAYEQKETPSLQGFLRFLATDETEIKREMEQVGNQVRIMTVHGAKGLEAPLVILAGNLQKPARKDLLLLDPEDHLPPLLLPPLMRGEPAAATARRAVLDAQNDDESHRLLYVALTRAEDKLIIASWKNQKNSNASEGSWFQLISAGLAGTTAHTYDFTRFEAGWQGDGLLLHDPAQGERREEKARPTQEAAAQPLPLWAQQPPLAEPTPSRPLTPSRAEDEPALTSPLADDEGYRFTRGLLIHRLLQTLPDLPPAQRRGAALRWLEGQTRHPARIADEVLAVLNGPEAEVLFGPQSKAEVPISGHVGARVLSGQIDRLAVTDNAVWLVDYKTNRTPPASLAEVPPAYLRQLAAYRAALTKLYPQKELKTLLLWTDGPLLMTIPDELLDAHAP